MDIDPLQDTVPPRYAYESDDEEDEPNPLRVQPSQPSQNVDVTILGDLPTNASIVIASSDAGTVWAKAAELGEQTGAVAVNNVQIGLAFNPSWTKSTVIISEALSALPLSAMQPYADKIVGALSPPIISLLDTYPVPTYVSEKPVPIDEAPIRYLTTLKDAGFLDSRSELFAPPNLIQSTSASFVNVATLSKISSTVILLPSPHIPRPRPDIVAPSNIHKLDQDDVYWSPDVINTAQDLAFLAVGETVSHPWKPSAQAPRQQSVKRQSEIGEGGMYI